MRSANLGKEIDGGAFFAKFAHFLVEPRDENTMTSICILHSCTEVPACTRYVANLEGYSWQWSPQPDQFGAG
jgi:hypothetical protein